MAERRELGGDAPSGLGFDLERYEVAELSLRHGAKWSGDKDRLAAWIADMDFPIAPPIARVLSHTLERDDLGYPNQALESDLRFVYAERLLKRYGLAVDPELVVVMTDVVQAIAVSLVTLTKPGDGVVFFTPTYPPFYGVVQDTGRRVVACELVRNDRYEIDFESLASLVKTEHPSCFLLCNPQNPTGRAFDRDELANIAEIAIDHDLIVISDEIHADLVLPGARHIPIASLSNEIAERTITIGSASKAFNIAGLRCAVAAFGSGDLAGRFGEHPAQLRGGIGILSVLGSLTAWREGDPWLEAVLSYLDANRSLTKEALSSREGVVYQAPEATYLAWLDLSGAGLGANPTTVLAQEAGVVCSAGEVFGVSGEGFVRLNFATPRPILEDMLARITTRLSQAPSGS